MSCFTLSFRRLRLLPFVAGALVTVCSPLITQPAIAAPPVSQTAPSRPRQVRFDVQITRMPAPPGASTTPNASGTPAATPPVAGDAAQTPPANGDNPTIVGTPTVTTFDRNTATVAVTGTGISYTLSLSPTVENADNAVQVLWNLRMNGKDLPGSTSAFTMSGASRVIAQTDTTLAEMSLTDPKTGQATVFRFRVRITVDEATATARPASP